MVSKERTNTKRNLWILCTLTNSRNDEGSRDGKGRTKEFDEKKNQYPV